MENQEKPWLDDFVLNINAELIWLEESPSPIKIVIVLDFGSIIAISDF